MFKILHYTYALSLFIIPLLSGIFFINTYPETTGLIVPFIFVMLFVFWGVIAMTASKVLPQKPTPLALTVFGTYGFYTIDILMNHITITEAIINLGMLQIFVMMIGFTFAVFLGPWIAGTVKKFTQAKWKRYTGTCITELFFIIPGIILITTTFELLIKDWVMLASLIAMCASMAKAITDISVYKN